MMLLRYSLGNSGQVAVFSEKVVAHLFQHRQSWFLSSEAGGQLFANFEGNQILVNAITGPRKTDWRTPFSYVPDRKAEQREIQEHFVRGLHYVGDWHTHPEGIPKPSQTDLRSMSECFAKSTHSLNGFLHVIVGRTPPPSGLLVVLHDAEAAHELTVQTSGE